MVEVWTRADLPVIAEVDVAVAGVGCAGVGAALAAARAGASVLALEPNGYAGGYITAVVGATFDGMFDMRTGHAVVGGISMELLQELNGVSTDRQTRYRSGADLVDVGPSPDGKQEFSGEALAVKINPERFKLVVDRRFAEAGVRVLYHTPVVDVVAEDGTVSALVVSTKQGPALVRAKTVVDATGDADVAAWAGAPFEISPEHQPMTLHFRVGNVDLTPEVRARCAAALAAAREAGRIDTYGGPWMARLAEDEVVFNAIRTSSDKIAIDGWTKAEIEGRRDAWEFFEIFREEVPEFRRAYLVATGPEAGARETRRITGEYTLTEDDVETTRAFDDAVVKGAWWMDRHPAGVPGYHQHVPVAPYDIPYRTLVPQRLRNVLVAGRCHSATPQALASSRVTMTAMGMGEAAGVAASMAARSGVSVRDVDSGDLRVRLLAAGAILD